MSSSINGQASKFSNSTVPFDKHDHHPTDYQSPYHHDPMLDIFELFPLEVFEDQEGNNAANWSSDEKKWICGLLDISLFG